MGKHQNAIWQSLLCTTLFASFFWGGLAQLDPFGFKTAADLHSESIFMRLIGGPWYASSAQNKITVVLIDDRYIEETGDHWPMPYMQQDLLLNDILGFKPKAIFLDLLYRHEHSDGVDQLIDTVNQGDRKKEELIPIYIPYLVRDIQGINSCEPHDKLLKPSSFVVHNSVLPQFRKSDVKPSYIGWTGCGNRYPSFIFGDRQLPTPAFGLYQTICKGNPSISPGCDQVNRNDFGAFKAPMVIRWGTNVSLEHQSALKKADIQCLHFNRNEPMIRIKYFFSQLWKMFKFE
ncbi:MAG: CHASE2 domain-containing protein, partial [Thiotrichaceae bacterium]